MNREKEILKLKFYSNDLDSCKDIVFLINNKTITLDKDKLEKFLIQFSKESEE